MCMYSMVMDWHQQKPLDWWTPDKWDTFQRLIPEIKELDRQLAQPDCESVDKEAELLRLAKELGYTVTIEKRPNDACTKSEATEIHGDGSGNQARSLTGIQGRSVSGQGYLGFKR